MKMWILSRVDWYLAVGSIVVWGVAHVEGQGSSELREVVGLRAKIVRLEAERSEAIRQATVCAAQLSLANAPNERQAMTQAMEEAALALGCTGTTGVDWSAVPVPVCRSTAKAEIKP